MSHALFLQNVTKEYDGHRAVDDLSIAIPRGSIYGILGPNGAGKSSTIRTALNILSKDGGTVRILDVDPADDPSILRRVGYLPEERGLYRTMRVIDVIVFFARLKGLERGDARREAGLWLEKLGLSEWAKTRVDALSKGMQQKVQFITTVLHQPDLLFLDEPSAGLDPVNQDMLKETILELREQGRTVVFSTHNMAEAERLCDSVCIISRGRKILDGSLEEIRRSNLGNRWRVEYQEIPAATAAFFGGDGFFESSTPIRRGWEVSLPLNVSPRDLFDRLAGFETVPTRFEQVEPSLHEIFVRHVGSTAANPPRREAADA